MNDIERVWRTFSDWYDHRWKNDEYKAQVFESYLKGMEEGAKEKGRTEDVRTHNRALSAGETKDAVERYRLPTKW